MFWRRELPHSNADGSKQIVADDDPLLGEVHVKAQPETKVAAQATDLSNRYQAQQRG